YWYYDRHRSVRLVILVGLAIDQIAQSGLSSLSVIYYSAQLFSGFTALDFLTPEEREEHHILRLSLAICVDEQSEANKRVNARLKARHEEYKAKRGAV
ncbi:hypothetical protein ABK950_24605, partial [Citrobacter freundii]|uniref:hypothetical protein n=1 Tax=Citrobacter freundii TaxID=546 RepID=UPI0037548B1C